MQIRRYEAERDRAAAQRVWRECGWMDDANEATLDTAAVSGDTWVAVLDGAAECVVTTTTGHMRHGRRPVSAHLVAGVTTSLVARRRGVAGRTSAHAVAESIDAGAALSVLGVFDQGYYDRLGYGDASYGRLVRLDPQRLRVPRPGPRRAPVRLSIEHAEEVHGNRNERRLLHGGFTFDFTGLTKASMEHRPRSFGLGFRDGATGRLTHHLWLEPGAGGGSPASVMWMAARTVPEILELLGLLADLGDQTPIVQLFEPPGVPLLGLLDRPHRAMRMSKGGSHEQTSLAAAFWQARIGDLPACVGAVEAVGPPVRFELELDDPLPGRLEGTPHAGRTELGAGGRWIVTLGPESSATRGEGASLPRLRASVGAFTRLWIGAASARVLAHVDRLEGPEDLLAEIDAALRLPEPEPDWDF